MIIKEYKIEGNKWKGVEKGKRPEAPQNQK